MYFAGNAGFDAIYIRILCMLDIHDVLRSA